MRPVQDLTRLTTFSYAGAACRLALSMQPHDAPPDQSRSRQLAAEY